LELFGDPTNDANLNLIATNMNDRCAEQRVHNECIKSNTVGKIIFQV